jgi:hypothetical protein
MVPTFAALPYRAVAPHVCACPPPPALPPAPPDQVFGPGAGSAEVYDGSGCRDVVESACSGCNGGRRGGAALGRRARGSRATRGRSRASRLEPRPRPPIQLQSTLNPPPPTPPLPTPHHSPPPRSVARHRVPVRPDGQRQDLHARRGHACRGGDHLWRRRPWGAPRACDGGRQRGGNLLRGRALPADGARRGAARRRRRGRRRGARAGGRRRGGPRGGGAAALRQGKEADVHKS